MMGTTQGVGVLRCSHFVTPSVPSNEFLVLVSLVKCDLPDLIYGTRRFPTNMLIQCLSLNPLTKRALHFYSN